MKRLAAVLLYLAPILIGALCVFLGLKPRETVWNGSTSQATQTWISSLGLILVGVPVALIGRKILRYHAQYKEPTFGGGLAGTVMALVGFLGYILLLAGVVSCGLAFFLPVILH